MSGIMSLLLAVKVGGGAFTEYKIFTASGNWTAPTGVTQVEYLVVAGWWWWRNVMVVVAPVDFVPAQV
jgi:hypothetical protein